MTQFVGVADMVRWVQQTGTAEIIAGMVSYIEDDFRRWASFDKIERIASHTPFGVIELMPISDADLYSFKYVNGHPFNPARGFQTVTAFGVLADVHNGYPVFMTEMTLLTALRTAATSVVAARALARTASTTMAMIGTGSQSEFQAIAFHRVLGIQNLRIFDVDRAAMEKFHRNIASLGISVTLCDSAAEAVRGADIITTCTADKATAVVLADAEVAAGVHINAIGGDCPGKTELDPAILRRSSVFVEYPPQTRIEGEVQRLEPEFPVTELWRVLAGKVSGRVSSDEITIFDSVGFAIEDFSAMRYLRDSVADTPLCIDIDLVATPEDPKDLFGFSHTPIPVM